MTPEERARALERIPILDRAVLKMLAQDNLEMFGTPIPEDLKD